VKAIVAAQDADARFAAYRWKMLLLALFVAVNVIFLVLVLVLPSTIVSYIFFSYIALSAVPKLLFGSLLHRINVFTRGDPQLKFDDNVAVDEDTELAHRPRKWILAGDPTDETAILVSCCVTVHHEDEEGLDAGVGSFEGSDLPFPPSALQVVYIVDGRRDRSGRLDPAQEHSVRYLLARICGLEAQPLNAVTSVDEDGVVYVKSETMAGPKLLLDGTAVYRGSMSGRRGAIPVIVLYKRVNGGKRHSHQMFLELTDNETIARPAHAVMFVDSDVKFAWPGSRLSLGRLYHGIMESRCIGGACGEIEVWKWTKNMITLMQFFEYCSNQFLAKTFESFFGMVTCLPGAFCMVRPQALEMVANKYLATATTIFEKNKLDLGEDRTMTTLILEAGWSTKYVPTAVAKTEAPDTLMKLLGQRRRWINSTVVNMYTLLSHVHRWRALPLIVALGFELASSFMLPTAVLMMFYQEGVQLGIYPPLVIAALVLWVTALTVVSMTSTLKGSMWLYEHSAIIGGFIVLLMMLSTVQNVSEFADKYFMEVVVVAAWVGCIAIASIIHGKAASVFGAIAPLSWLLLSPISYVILPIYAIANFDEVSWGTRGA